MRRSGWLARELGTQLAAIAPSVRSQGQASGHYPLVSRMVVEAEDFPDPDAVFSWQLDRVLDGLAAIIPAPKPKPG